MFQLPGRDSILGLHGGVEGLCGEEVGGFWCLMWSGVVSCLSFDLGKGFFFFGSWLSGRWLWVVCGLIRIEKRNGREWDGMGWELEGVRK